MLKWLAIYVMRATRTAEAIGRADRTSTRRLTLRIDLAGDARRRLTNLRLADGVASVADAAIAIALAFVDATDITANKRHRAIAIERATHLIGKLTSTEPQSIEHAFCAALAIAIVVAFDPATLQPTNQRRRALTRTHAPIARHELRAIETTDEKQTRKQRCSERPHMPPSGQKRSGR